MAAEAEEAKRSVAGYILGPTLGSGLQGKVKCGWHKESGQQVALKLVDRARIKEGSREKTNLEREIAAMKALKHENVVQLKEVNWNVKYPKKNGTVKDMIMIVLELATGGELFDFMMYTGSFPESIGRSYFQQLVSGMLHCHKKGICHRDLKPENLLLSGEFVLKIADFGLSALGENPDGTPVLLRTECGTRGYMAPEVLEGRPYDGQKADVWSAGVILFITLAGFPPFQMAASSDWWYNRILNKQYPLFWEAHLRSATFSKEAMAFMNRMFVADPAERASFADLLEDPWMKAETMSADALKADLTRRKAAVQAEKRREKEAEERKRAAAAASAAFDPFARDVTRAVGDHHEEDAGKPQAPPLPTTVAQRYTYFYSRAHPAELTRRLEQAFSSMSAKYTTDESKYKVKAFVNTTTGRQVGMTARVYRHPSGINVVDMSRRAGDMLKFQEVYNVVCDMLSDVVSAPPAEGDNGGDGDESKADTGAGGDAEAVAAATEAADAAAAALAAAEAAVAAASQNGGGDGDAQAAPQVAAVVDDDDGLI